MHYTSKDKKDAFPMPTKTPRLTAPFPWEGISLHFILVAIMLNTIKGRLLVRRGWGVDRAMFCGGVWGEFELAFPYSYSAFLHGRSNVWRVVGLTIITSECQA